MGNRKELHIVLSSMGGCGKTRISSQIAEARNASIVDLNTSNRDISKFKGLETFMDTEGFYESPYMGNLSEYLNTHLHYLLKDLIEKDQHSVVVDTDTATGAGIVSLFLNDSGYLDNFTEYNICPYFHVVVPSISFGKKQDIIERLADSPSVPDGSVAVWVNSFRESFPFTMDVNTRKEEIAHSLGSKFGTFVDIGEDYPALKLTVSAFFQDCTFSYLSENRPIGCDGFQYSRIRNFDLNFKYIVGELMKVLEGVSDSEDEISDSKKRTTPNGLVIREDLLPNGSIEEKEDISPQTKESSADSVEDIKDETKDSIQNEAKDEVILNQATDNPTEETVSPKEKEEDNTLKSDEDDDGYGYDDEED